MKHQVMSRASVAKECYEAHRQPWEAEQLEEESVKKVKTSLVDLTIFVFVFVYVFQFRLLSLI